MTSPFTGRRPAFVKRVQARRPMPRRVTFTGMFYPALILFTSLPLPETANFMSFLFTEMQSLNFILMSPSTLNLVAVFALLTIPLIGPITLPHEIVTIFFKKLPHFEAPQVLISFLPEITLALMITYLIGILAVELSENRAPKVLAIEC